MSSAGHAANLSGCVARPKAREIGLIGFALVGCLKTLLNYQLPGTVAQALVLAGAVIVVRFRPRGLVPA
jgi:hypothetical protein